MANTKIRDAAKANGVKLWMVADRIGVQDTTFSRMLRHELPKQKQAEILKAISEIAKEADNAE